MPSVNDELERIFPAYRSHERETAREAAKLHWPTGSVVRGIVLAHFPFGVLVDIDVKFPAIILITRLKNADEHPYTSTDKFPAIGSIIEAKVCAWVEDARQIALTQLDACDY